MTDRRLKQIINEELTKTEVNNMIQSKLQSHLKSNDFKKKVKELSAAVIADVFKVLWQRNNFWKRTVSNS